MTMHSILSTMKRSEILDLIDELNLNEEETQIVWMLSRNSSIEQIARRLHCSSRTIDRRIYGIKRKMNE